MNLYKYYKCSDKFTLENIENNQIYFSCPNAFDDVLDSNLKIIDFQNNIIFDNRKQDFRVACFSADLSDYMWKNYADNGDGFCLVYDRKELEKISKDIIEVEYYHEDIIYMKLSDGLTKYVLSGFDKKIGMCLLIASCKYKSLDYCNEHEYRILSKKEKVYGIRPKIIIAGGRVSEKNRAAVKRFCDANNIEFIIKK